MKKWTKCLLSVGLVSVVAFGGCELLEPIATLESEKVEKPTGGAWEDRLAAYEIFDGEYEEVDMDVIKTKIINDSRYQAEDIYDVWTNNEGTYIEYSMLGVINGMTLASLIGSERALTGTDSLQAYGSSVETRMDGSVLEEQYYYENDAAYSKSNTDDEWIAEDWTYGSIAHIPDGADPAALSELEEILERHSAGDEEGGMAPFEWNKTILLCEEDEYIKVKLIATGETTMTDDEVGAGVVTLQLICAYVFNQDLELIALGSASNQQLEAAGGTQAQIIFSVAVPWEGTITKPEDLP